MIKKNINKLIGRFYTGPGTMLADIINQGYGHKLSVIEKKCIDADGRPLPWYTYPAIEFIKQLDCTQKTVFEWGAGFSSIFWSQRALKVYSAESSEEWYNKILPRLNPNNLLTLVSGVAYINEIKVHGTYDIIIIDGEWRDECTRIAHDYLNDGGIIIFDNSDRHPELCAYLRSLQMIEIDFHGFGPMNSYTWTTSVFIHRKYNFKPLTIQPLIPIGGGY